VVQWCRKLDESTGESDSRSAIADGSSRLAEVTQDRVNELESLIDLFSNLGASQDYLAADEDEKYLTS
jgi:hypothetical protein